MATVQTTGIEVVAIYVTELERAKAFYTEQLGMTLGDAMPPGVMLKAGDDSIYLRRLGTESPASRSRCPSVSAWRV